MPVPRCGYCGRELTADVLDLGFCDLDHKKKKEEEVEREEYNTQPNRIWLYILLVLMLVSCCVLTGIPTYVLDMVIKAMSR